MRTSLQPPIHLGRLAHFVAVANRLNMTTAAADLHLSQQAVSSSIRQLEREIGAEVFIRTGRHIQLTPAGYVLLQGAIPLLAAGQSLLHHTTAAARELPAPYIVGHTPAITSDEVFELLDPIRRELPALPIEVRQMYPQALQDAVLDATIDVGFRRGVTAPTSLAGAVIAHHRLNIAVAKGHPLSTQTTVTMADLAEHTLIVWAPPRASFYTDYLVSVCRRAGFEPTIVVNRIQGTTPATAVVDTDCYAFVTQTPGTTLHGHVHIIPIGDPPNVPTQAIWLPHTTSRPRQTLLAATEPN